MYKELYFFKFVNTLVKIYIQVKIRNFRQGKMIAFSVLIYTILNECDPNENEIKKFAFLSLSILWLGEEDFRFQYRELMKYKQRTSFTYI